MRESLFGSRVPTIRFNDPQRQSLRGRAPTTPHLLRRTGALPAGSIQATEPQEGTTPMAEDDKRPAKTDQPTPAPEKDKGMHKVDQTTQEQASEEREKSGGYD